MIEATSGLADAHRYAQRGSFYYDLAKAEVLYYPRLEEAKNLSALDAMVPLEEVLVHLNGSSQHVMTTRVREVPMGV